MEERTIDRLGRAVSVVGLGTWQLGADWGSVTPDAAHSVLDAAVERGITFFDTADVYGDGRSERFCAELRARHPDVLIATKMGRRAEQLWQNYNRDNFLAWNERSRRLIMHHDRSIASATAWVWLSQARLLVRRLTNA